VKTSLGTFIAAIALIPVSALAQSEPTCDRWVTFDEVAVINQDQLQLGALGGAFLPDDKEDAAAIVREAADAMARRFLDPRVDTNECGTPGFPKCNGQIHICFWDRGAAVARKAASAKP